jgi:serine/threonine-protein kinase
MAPEQARAMTVDARTDIYALGIVLYETITGERPFRGDTIDQVLKAQILEQAVPPSTKRPLPGALERLILRCLEKAPDARPQSAAEIETELRAIAATLAKPTKKLDRKSWGIWLLFFAVAIAAGIAWAIR